MRIAGVWNILGAPDNEPKETAMSMMDKLKQMLKGHEKQANQGVDKAGDYVDGRTEGKYRTQTDMAQEQLKRRIGPEDPPPPAR
ncbi:antitoxin [Streptomyces sp. A1136]|uniref:antitoxin n=1 Tax=Streptomyces sp. A1136 TaxID=2563102 RepID=UPI0026C97950|nr:antitoxin [Streptomyces sp. A1136]